MAQAQVYYKRALRYRCSSSPLFVMALPMKTMKSMKKSRSKVAHGRMAKAMVLRGSKVKTVGGLTKSDVMKNKRGRIVSKKASSTGKRRYHGSKAESWIKAIVAARKALGIHGFVAIKGKTAQGKALYAKAMSIYNA